MSMIPDTAAALAVYLAYRRVVADQFPQESEDDVVAHAGRFGDPLAFGIVHVQLDEPAQRHRWPDAPLAALRGQAGQRGRLGESCVLGSAGVVAYGLPNCGPGRLHDGPRD